jgi:hypothetical protein
MPPQVEPSVAQAWRPPRGAWLEGIGLQVPTLPATSQAAHRPSQAVLQQTPSTQLPLPHWSAALQLPPGFFFGVQTPAAQ